MGAFVEEDEETEQNSADCRGVEFTGWGFQPCELLH